MKKIGQADSDLYRRCSVEETGSHAALGYMVGEEWGRSWSTWAQMDEKAMWRRVKKGPDDEEIFIDLVAEWFDECWRNAGGRV